MQSQDELIGTLVGQRYRVIERLGQGGMGNVYLALHEAIEKRIALKVLRLEFSIKPDLVTRFQQEAISASRIKHPGVLDVFDFGRLDNGCFFIAMELLEGHDLADELEQRRVVVPERATRIAVQICRALAAAHSQGVVHRDLKPENVYLHVTSDGAELVKVVDFGIAQLRSTEELAAQQTERRRLTRTGMIFGTPEYMSPEQALGKPVDLRADIYAAGIILYEMLTGAVPFTGDTFFGVLNAHLNQPLPAMKTLYPALEISEALEATIIRALAKDRDARFQTMRDFASALCETPEGAHVGALPGATTVPAIGPRELEVRARVTEAQFADDAVLRQAREVTTQPETQLEAHAVPAPVPRRVSAGKLALALLAGAGALAAAALVLSGRGKQPEPLASPPSAAPSAREPAPPASPPPAPIASAPPPPPVRLSIESVPMGATVLKGGFQVCDETPCEVEVPRDAQIELEAKLGNRRGSAKVLAQRDQRVRIELGAPGAAPRAPAAGPKDCWTDVVTDSGMKMPMRVPCR